MKGESCVVKFFTCMKRRQYVRRSNVDLHVSSGCFLSYGTGRMEESQKENLCMSKFGQEQ